MRRRPLHLAALAVIAALAWTAAPAFSLDPYLPEPEDFEQRLIGVERVLGAARGGAEGEHADEGPVTHLSDPIVAPHRFDLVGIAGEVRVHELRARDEGGEWSEWVETGNGDPVYFGGADEVQVRTRGWRPSGRLHYVNVSGTTSVGDSLLNGFRGTVNGAVISAASVIEPAAMAEAPRPPKVSRKAWGASDCRPRKRPSYGKVKVAVVHHTVTANDYSRTDAPRIVLGICRFHRNGNGWNDIGYNALVDRFGRIYVGRAGGFGRAVIGAHTAGFNAQTTGVASLGTHTTTPISSAGSYGISRFLAWKLPHHGTRIGGRTRVRSAGGSGNPHRRGKRVRTKRINGHRRFNLTSCPGDAGKRQLKQIRRKARRIAKGSATEPPPEPKSPPPDDSGDGGVLPAP